MDSQQYRKAGRQDGGEGPGSAAADGDQQLQGTRDIVEYLKKIYNECKKKCSKTSFDYVSCKVIVCSSK